MGARFKGTFYSAFTAKKYDLTILDESGSFVLNDITLTECNINYLAGDDTRFDTVMAAELTAKILIDSQLLDDWIVELAGAAEGRFLVKLEQDNVLEFIGYILPDLAEQEDLPIEVGYLFTIKATDGLGRLKTIDYNNNGLAYGGSTPFIDIILKCLNKLTAVSNAYGSKADFLKTLVNWHAEQYTYANTIDPLLITRVPERAFYTKDTKGNFKWKSCFEVLQEICKAWGARMMYSRASFWVVQVNELANPTSRKFFNYSKTATQTSETISIDVTHDQNSAATELIRISGGKFTFLPPLKYARIDYKHIATENLLAGEIFPQNTPFVFGDVDDQGGIAKFYVSTLFTYSVTNRADPPGVIGLWLVFSFRIEVADLYLNRQLSFSGGVPQYGAITWSGSNAARYQVALYVPEDEEEHYATVGFLTDFLPASGEFVFDITLDKVFTGAGFELSLTSSPPGTFNWSAGNLMVEHLYEGTLDNQSDLRRFQSNNNTTGNSAVIEIETIIGDGIGVNSPGHLQVLDDNTDWVLAEDWRIGNSGSFIPFSALLAQEIIRGQLTPIRKFNGNYNNKGESLYRAHNVIDHAWGKLLMMSGDFNLYLDEVNGIWFYIDPESSGWTNAEFEDFPDGEDAKKGTPKSLVTDDGNQKPIERTFREEFTGVTDTLTVTENNGLLPSNPNQIWVYQNGQLISNTYYTITGDTITLSYEVESWDIFVVVFQTI